MIQNTINVYEIKKNAQILTFNLPSSGDNIKRLSRMKELIEESELDWTGAVFGCLTTNSSHVLNKESAQVIQEKLLQRKKLTMVFIYSRTDEDIHLSCPNTCLLYWKNHLGKNSWIFLELDHNIQHITLIDSQVGCMSISPKTPQPTYISLIGCYVASFESLGFMDFSDCNIYLHLLNTNVNLYPLTKSAIKSLTLISMSNIPISSNIKKISIKIIKNGDIPKIYNLFKFSPDRWEIIGYNTSMNRTLLTLLEKMTINTLKIQ